MEKTPQKTETVAETSKNSSESSVLTNVVGKAASVPAVLKPTTALKVQISAPSYLLSLKENDAPPFKRPGKEAKPHILTGTIMTDEEAIEMVAAAEKDPINGFKMYFAHFLVEKKLISNYNLSERNFLISFLRETVEYAAQHDFTAHKLACLLTVYLSAHLYFRWYYWSPPAAVWAYFKEIMIRHTIEDSPDGEEVFEPEECYDIVTHFHTTYLSNLPLVHLLTFGSHQLKLHWPFNPAKPK